MVTMARPTPSLDAAPPPTMASAGVADTSANAAIDDIANFIQQK